MLAAGGYFVLGKNGDMGTNGGVAVDYVFGSTDMFLANGFDEAVSSGDLSEGSAQRTHCAGERSGADDLIGPHHLEQLLVAPQQRSVYEQVEPKTQGLRLDRDQSIALAQLEDAGVEFEIRE